MRLGTRGSALALAQARSVAAALGGDVEIVEITTAGDVNRAAGDKSRWVGAIESALLAGEIDVAVHSAKDVPGELAEGCAIVAAPPRASTEDLLIGAPSLDALPEGARVGTSAVRRRAQLLAVRPDLQVVELRGNVDTRLRKLATGDLDAIVLARAGLERLERLGGGSVTALPGDERPSVVLAEAPFVPAPGQGTLALEAREGDERFTTLADPAATAELAAERDAVRVLGASCHTPVGVRARRRDDGRLHVRGFAGLPDGSAWVYDEVRDAPGGEALAERMLAAGAGELLARAEALAR